MPLVQATALTRRFGTRVAVHDVSFSLNAGEIVALLGPNGAGKTTTLRMLAGLIMPSSGNVTIRGELLTTQTADRLRHHIGLLTEAPGLWDRLSVELNLLTYARLYRLPGPRAVVSRALESLGIADRVQDLAGTLSKGLRQRVAIARALLHDPPVVLLDEPTSGLDPAAARMMRNLIADLRRDGRAILVSTHNLTEAEELADRIAILKTDLLALDTPNALSRRWSSTRVAIEVDGSAERWLSLIPARFGEQMTAVGSQLLATLHYDRVPDLVSALAAAGARIKRVTPDQRSLEEVYLALVADDEGGA